MKNKDEEIRDLIEELNLLKEEYDALEQTLLNINIDIQSLDRQSRRIMYLVAEGDFETLKSEHQIDFEISDGNLYFDTDNYFPIEKAGLSMVFAFYNPNLDFKQIGYFLNDTDEKYEIVFHYDHNKRLKYAHTY